MLEEDFSTIWQPKIVLTTKLIYKALVKAVLI